MRAGDLRVRAEHLDEAHIAALLAERQALYARDERGEWRDTSELLVWSIGRESYATPLADIREIAPVPHVTRIPGAPPHLLGLIARRGVIHNLFDPAPVLGAAAAEEGATQRMLLLRWDHPCIAIRVSGADRIAALPADMDDGGEATLTTFTPDSDAPFARVSTRLLIEQLLARHGPREG